MRLGAEALSNAELVALILGTGRRGENVLSLAQRLLERFGGLAGLRLAEVSELETIAGIGRARAMQLLALGELSIRATSVPLEVGETLDTGTSVWAAFAPRLANEAREHFIAIALDVKRRVIGHWCVATGHLAGVEVHPREVFRPLVRAAAAAAVVVHNHPSGDPTPSAADYQLTWRLREAGMAVGIELLDHVIVARERHASLRELGAFDKPATSRFSTAR